MILTSSLVCVGPRGWQSWGGEREQPWNGLAPLPAIDYVPPWWSVAARWKRLTYGVLKRREKE